MVGSFIADGKKTNINQSGPSSSSAAPPSHMLNFGPPEGASPTSQGGGSSESSDDNGGSPPLNRGPLPYNNVGHPIHQMPMYGSMAAWPNSTMNMLPN